VRSRTIIKAPPIMHHNQSSPLPLFGSGNACRIAANIAKLPDCGGIIPKALLHVTYLVQQSCTADTGDLKRLFWRGYVRGEHRSVPGIAVTYEHPAKVSGALFTGYFTRSHQSILTGSPNGTAR
jgi:hypothetical protein